METLYQITTQLVTFSRAGSQLYEFRDIEFCEYLRIVLYTDKRAVVALVLICVHACSMQHATYKSKTAAPLLLLIRFLNL